MNKKLYLTDGLIRGFVLWLIGYALGFILFPVAPTYALGWLIMPIGIAVTLWVLIKKINRKLFRDYIFIATIWTVIALVCDYLFLVKLLHPADGYYKLDVYLYYILTFALPLLVGWKKCRRPNLPIDANIL